MRVTQLFISTTNLDSQYDRKLVDTGINMHVLATRSGKYLSRLDMQRSGFSGNIEKLQGEFSTVSEFFWNAMESCR